MPNPPRPAPVDHAALKRLAARWSRVATAGGVLAVALVIVVELTARPDTGDVSGRGAAAALMFWDVPRLAFVPDPLHPAATLWASAYLLAGVVAVGALIARAVVLRRVARARRDSRALDPRTRRRARRAREKAAKLERRQHRR